MALIFALRRLSQLWQESVLLWLGLLILGALPAGLPLYAMTIAGRSLEQRLGSAPVGARNILISGAGLNDELYHQIAETLGPLLARRISVRNIEIEGLSSLYTGGEARSFEEFLALYLFAFSDLERDVTVLQGRLPEVGEGEIIEAAVGADILSGPNFSTVDAGQISISNLQIGDELRTPGGARFRIVGVVAPVDPGSDVWWGTQLPFHFTREERHGSSQPETVVLSLLIPAEALAARFPEHAHQWRLLTDLDTVTIDNVASVQSAVRDVETRLATNFLQVDSGLELLLETFITDLDRGRVLLFLLASPAFILAALVFLLLASDLVARRRAELITLETRGAGLRRLLLSGLMEIAVLIIAATAIAPLAAAALLWAMQRAGGIGASPVLPAYSWLWALAGTAAGGVIYLLILWVQSRRSRLPAPVVTPSARPLWQRYFLDLLLLLAGGLVYWQTTGGQTSVARPTNAGTADPLLLIGPTLLLLGAVLLATRLYPIVLRIPALAARGSSLLWPYELARQGREPGAGRLVLIVSLAVAVALFAALAERSLAARQAELAHYLVGADVRLSVETADDFGAVTDAIADWSGVTAATAVYRNPRARWAPEISRQATLLGLDPAGFGRVARYPENTAGTAMPDILDALAVPTGAALPAVFSRDAYPHNRQIGDIVPYMIGGNRVDFEVRGIIGSFPSLEGAFILTDLAALEERVDLAQLGDPFSGRREIWLNTESETDVWPPGSQVIATAAGTRESLAADMAGQQAIAALRLNRWAATLISAAAVTGFLALTGRRRLREFDLLRVMGASRRQWLSLLQLDGVLSLVVGLAAGTLVGYGLARMMLPVLSGLLSASLGGEAIRHLALDWPALSGLYVRIVGLHLVGLLALPVIAHELSSQPRRLGIEAE